MRWAQVRVRWQCGLARLAARMWALSAPLHISPNPGKRFPPTLNSIPSSPPGRVGGAQAAGVLAGPSKRRAAASWRLPAGAAHGLAPWPVPGSRCWGLLGAVLALPSSSCGTAGRHHRWPPLGLVPSSTASSSCTPESTRSTRRATERQRDCLRAGQGAEYSASQQGRRDLQQQRGLARSSSTATRRALARA